MSPLQRKITTLATAQRGQTPYVQYVDDFPFQPVTAKKLTSEQRDSFKSNQFAVPAKRKLPLVNKEHIILAWRLLPRTKGLTAAEIEEAKKHILAAAHAMGISTEGWNA